MCNMGVPVSHSLTWWLRHNGCFPQQAQQQQQHSCALASLHIPLRDLFTRLKCPPQILNCSRVCSPSRPTFLEMQIDQSPCQEWKHMFSVCLSFPIFSLFHVWTCSPVTQFRAKLSCLVRSVQGPWLVSPSWPRCRRFLYLLTPSMSLSLLPSAHTFSLFFFKPGTTAVYLRLRLHKPLCRFKVKSGRIDTTAAWLCTLCYISISSTFIRREKRLTKRWFLSGIKIQNKTYVTTSILKLF